MNRFWVKIVSAFWIVIFLFFLITLLGVAYLPYPYVNREPSDFEILAILMFLLSIVFLVINLIIAFWFVKKGFIKTTKYKYFSFIIPVAFYIVALLSPLYLVYFSNVHSLKIRADQRAYEGNWEQAIDAYTFIKPRLKGQNPNISRIQSWLKKAGYYENEIDGIVNDKILEQLKSFQRENNLEPDGIIGENTQFILFNKIFKERLDSIKSLNNVQEINEELNNFILINDIIEYDNTKAILLGIMFQESLGLMTSKLKLENLREAVKNIDDGYVPNGRFNNEIIAKLINLDKNK